MCCGMILLLDAVKAIDHRGDLGAGAAALRHAGGGNDLVEAGRAEALLRQLFLVGARLRRVRRLIRLVGAPLRRVRR